MIDAVQVIYWPLFGGASLVGSFAAHRHDRMFRRFIGGNMMLVTILMSAVLGLDLGGLRTNADVVGTVVIAAILGSGAIAIGFMMWLVDYYTRSFQSRRAE